MATAREIGLKLTKQREEHGTWLAAFKKDDGYDMTSDQLTEFRTRTEELNTLQAQYEGALEVEKSAAQNETKLASQGRIVPGENPTDSSRKLTTAEGIDAAWKSAFQTHGRVLSDIAKGNRGHVSFDLNADLKTVLAVTVHAPQADRQHDNASALYFGNTEDLFPSGTTSSKSIDYFIQTTDTDNTATVAEGSAVTDSAFAWTATTNPVETIQAWIPMTHEAVADNAGLQSTVEGYLARRLQKKVNSQLLAGDGNTPNLSGVSIVTGVQTQAKSTDPAFDAIMKAITLVAVTGDADPSAIVMHPTDWQNIILTRTVDGLYILGNPNSVPSPSLWGLPVRVTTGLAAAGTALVGAFATQAQVFNREGLTVEISTEHSTYFTERKVAVMLYRRLALADYRPSAFAKVTGL